MLCSQWRACFVRKKGECGAEEARDVRGGKIASPQESTSSVGGSPPRQQSRVGGEYSCGLLQAQGLRQVQSSASGQPERSVHLPSSTGAVPANNTSNPRSQTQNIAKMTLRGALVLLLIAGAALGQQECDPDMVGFEMVTGYVYSSPKDLLDSIPGTLMLTDCLEACQTNEQCRAVNYETGLCVLFSSTADQQPEALSSSQFPVFTIYAQKSCFMVKPCERAWCFDRVPGYTLKGYTRATHQAASRQECLELCLGERDFPCRSANYNNGTGECALSDMDRITLSGTGAFQRAAIKKKRQEEDVPEEIELDMDFDYLENNCVDEPSKMCDFRRVAGRILKTVDAVYQDVDSLEECRELCLAAPFKCRSYDFGDTGENVCRLSHHSRSTLGGSVGEPYLMVPEANTYELWSCYNVSVECRSSGMVAKIQTTKLFNGKVYVKGSPNSCARDVSRSLEFELRMPYDDVDCNVKREGLGRFGNAVVIQHHPNIVTSSDLGLAVSCQYDLSNMTVANELDLKVQDPEPGDGPGLTHEVVVDSPSVAMRITERVTSEDFDAQLLRDPARPEADMPVNDGLPEARVGDPLALQFVIMDPESPYEIFVRDLVAMDGADGAEIQLIDERGCPTDSFIMGPLVKMGKVRFLSLEIYTSSNSPNGKVLSFWRCQEVAQPFIVCNFRRFQIQFY
ncbi:Hypothetical predicted protein [Cloeon dipterum]|uniref:ZP domain-containing protein n=1 Tax=Cloeon dipterum TaxID=197152 RepID=A0A8S1D510_9INSE|nr:Hypothetical predicted protein [Cloeon dipterum]